MRTAASLDSVFLQRVFLIKWSILLGSAAVEVLPMRNPPFQCLLRNTIYSFTCCAHCSLFWGDLQPLEKKEKKTLLKFTATDEKRKKNCKFACFQRLGLFTSRWKGLSSFWPFVICWQRTIELCEVNVSFLIHTRVINISVKLSDDPDKPRVMNSSPHHALLYLFVSFSIPSVQTRLCTDWPFSTLFFFVPLRFFQQPNKFHLAVVCLPSSFRPACSLSLRRLQFVEFTIYFARVPVSPLGSHLSGGPCCSLWSLCAGFDRLEVLTVCRPPKPRAKMCFSTSGDLMSYA